MSKIYLAFLFSGFAIAALFTGSVVFASTTNGIVSGYAWADKIGWINFGVTTGNVHITDTVMTGYAWSDNYGWINLAPTKSGVKNDSEGNLSQGAWGWNLGWIDFASTKVNSLGIFTGTATGDDSGTINFSCAKCNVHTDWRPASSRVMPSSAGGVIGSEPPKNPISFLINNGNLYTNNQTVSLSLTAGQGAYTMMISNFSDFSNASLEPYSTQKTWKLADIDGQKNVYVKFLTNQNVASQVISSSIILDTQAPDINITSEKKIYDQNEEVLITGITETGAEVDLFLDDEYGSFIADKNGEFFITFGKLNIGNHNLELFAKDKAGNIGKSVKTEFLVKSPETVELNPQKPSFFQPIIDKIQQGLKPLLPNLITSPQKPIAETPILDKIGQGLYSLLPFLPKPKESQIATKLPTPVVMVPKISPMAFGGRWNIFPTKEIKQFVLSPLPKDIAILAQKFPGLKKTFKEVGIGKITDVKKIQNTNLTLPGLTETLGLSKIEITPGKFIPAKGVPVANLTNLAKEKIPSDIIFAKTGGGLVDYSIALSLNENGRAQQKIETLVGSPLQLVFKTDEKVRRVSGYFVFKSKKLQPPLSTNVLPNSLSFSNLFSAPSFVAALTPSINIPIEGSKNIEFDSQNGVKLPQDLEKRLVLSTFDYQNTGGGVYIAMVNAPVVDGEYEVITVVDYENDGLVTPISKEVKLVTVVDPEGYIYEKNGDKETRIVGAVISLYWLNPKTKQYELWQAGDFQQENPQVTNVSGSYSFLVPEGNYYLKVDAPGYMGYDGKPFEVREGSGVHVNIELKTKYWWLNIVDWKTALLVVVILMLVYNFYRDRKRDRLLVTK